MKVTIKGTPKDNILDSGVIICPFCGVMRYFGKTKVGKDMKIMFSCIDNTPTERLGCGAHFCVKKDNITVIKDTYFVFDYKLYYPVTLIVPGKDKNVTISEFPKLVAKRRK